VLLRFSTGVNEEIRGRRFSAVGNPVMRLIAPGVAEGYIRRQNGE
jgi:hypothetical protein